MDVPSDQIVGNRCRHCAVPLSKDIETSRWTLAPFIRDSFSMSPWSATLSITFPFSFIGTALGGTASAFYGFNHAIPIARRLVAGPMWFQYHVGIISGNAFAYIIFTKLVDSSGSTGNIVSSTCAGLAGGAVPALAQLVSSSYHAATTSSISSSSSNDEKMQKTRTTSL